MPPDRRKIATPPGLTDCLLDAASALRMKPDSVIVLDPSGLAQIADGDQVLR